MTREETIRKVLDTVLWTGNASDDNKRILTNALIKALEKESVLDEIRAEMEKHRLKTESIDPYDLVGDCLDIIDKYKAEREDEEHDR